MKLEKMQRRALRIVLKDHSSSYKTLLENANVPSLYVSRIHNIGIETYKSIHGINPKFLHDIVTFNNTSYDLRDNMKCIQPKVNSTTYGLNSFKYECTRIWNEIPIEIKQMESLPSFISHIRNWPGPQCSCGHCILCKIGLL